MRFPRLRGATAPVAELLIVSALFWMIVCGKAASDLLGDVAYRGVSLDRALELERRSPELMRHPSVSRLEKPEWNAALVDLLLDRDRRLMGPTRRPFSEPENDSKMAAADLSNAPRSSPF